MIPAVAAAIVGLLLLAVMAAQPLLSEVDNVTTTNRTRLDGTPLTPTYDAPCVCGALPGQACRCDLPPVVCMPANPTITRFALVGGHLRQVATDWDSSAVTA